MPIGSKPQRLGETRADRKAHGVALSICKWACVQLNTWTRGLEAAGRRPVTREVQGEFGGCISERHDAAAGLGGVHASSARW